MPLFGSEISFPVTLVCHLFIKHVSTIKNCMQLFHIFIPLGIQNATHRCQQELSDGLASGTGVLMSFDFRHQ